MSTQEKAQHTPAPWLVENATVYALHGAVPRNRFFALVQRGRRDDASEDECYANARRIVQCVNSHDELVRRLTWAVSFIDIYAAKVAGPATPELKACRAAIAKAGSAS